MATTPDSVLQTFLSQNFAGSTPWNLKGTYLHRLVASFIWLRANALSTRQNLSAAAAVTEVTKEIPQVKSVVTDRLGTDNRAGPLAGAQNPETPAHLDLSDVAKVRTTDLDAPDPERTKAIQKIQAAYVRERRREVLGILWRAAALEFQLWEDTAMNLVSLDVGSLKNLLDRRLRAIERLHVHIGPQSGGRTLATVTTHNSGWFDNMRVRLFEYPHVTLSPAQRPVVAPDVGTVWQGQPGIKLGPNDNQTLFYAVLQPAAVRQYNGSSTDTQPVPPSNAWRFPSATQPNWVVSPGKNSGYRIDLTPTGSSTGATPGRARRAREKQGG